MIAGKQMLNAKILGIKPINTINPIVKKFPMVSKYTGKLFFEIFQEKTNASI